MTAQHLPGLVLILLFALQFWIMFAVGRARARSGIKAPAMTGDAALERAVRVQANTIEQLALFAPAWLLSLQYWGPKYTGIFGLVWIAGRVWYALGYWNDANKRGSGFIVALAANAVLLVGGAWGWLQTFN